MFSRILKLGQHRTQNKQVISRNARIHLFSSIVDLARFSNPIRNVPPTQFDPGVLGKRQTENKALISMAACVRGSKLMAIGDPISV